MSPSDDQKLTNVISALNDVYARQGRIEERLLKIESSLSGNVAAAPAEPETVREPRFRFVDPVPTVEEPVSVYAVAQTPPPEKTGLETRVGLTIVNRIGVLTLVLGIAFFFKWAVDNNWIGPAGRVMLGLLAGFATLALADILWRRAQQVFAQGLTGTGIAIIYLAFYAAFNFYRLITQPLAFVFLVATTAMAATLALRYNASAIAALGFVGAYLTPLLLSNGEDHPWFLIAYLLVLNFAATELAKRRGWRMLELLSFSATVIIFGLWLFNNDAVYDRLPATIGALALCAQRFRTSWPVLFLIAQFLTALAICERWNGEPSKVLLLAMLIAAGGLAFAHLRKYPAIVPTVFASFWIGAAIIRDHSPSSIMPVAVAGFLLFTVITILPRL